MFFCIICTFCTAWLRGFRLVAITGNGVIGSNRLVTAILYLALWMSEYVFKGGFG